LPPSSPHHHASLKPASTATRCPYQPREVFFFLRAPQCHRECLAMARPPLCLFI
jgi:hypothetical protein